MKKSTRFVGLDDSKHSIDVAVAAEDRDGEVRFYGTIPNTTEALKKLVRRLGVPQDLHFVYEAGPCGYGTYRDLLALGYVLTRERDSLAAYRWLWENRRHILNRRADLRRRRTCSSWQLNRWFFRRRGAL